MAAAYIAARNVRPTVAPRGPLKRVVVKGSRPHPTDVSRGRTVTAMTDERNLLPYQGPRRLEETVQTVRVCVMRR